VQDSALVVLDAREILSRLEMLAPRGPENHLTVETMSAKSAGDLETVWDGVEFQGTYYAWIGPLLALEDRAAVPHSLPLIKALEACGVQVSFGNPEMLSDHLGRGRCQVFATDKKSWRRPVTRGRQLLLVKPPDDTKD
jgi:hypothetical protein